MKRLVTLVVVFALVGALSPSLAAADSNNAPATFELHLEEPNISVAPNGDEIAVTGEGVFSVHPKSVTASGGFTHTDSAGSVLATGVWTATQLLSFEFYGCGVVTFPDPDVILPPDFCGGALKLSVTLTPDGAGLSIPGVLTIFCIVGPQTPVSHDDPSEEGIHLVVPGFGSFNRIMSGMNIYIQTS